MNISNVTAFKLKEDLEENRFCATDIVRNVFEKISSLNDKINAYITLFEKEALYDAEKFDSSNKDTKNNGYLKGIPTAITENLIEEDNTVVSYKNTILSLIKEAGAIILGATSHPANNPWNIERTAGFVSGGAAAAVATGMASIAVSLDSADNIIESAAFCGVLGFRPTKSYSTKYCFEENSALEENLGFFTKNVRDCALLLDSLCRNENYAYIENYNLQCKELKIAVIEDFLDRCNNKEIKECIESGISILIDLGFIVDKITFSDSIDKKCWNAIIKELFMSYDVIITPSTYTLPYFSHNAEEIVRNSETSAFKDLPLLSIPCGFSSSDLPIGLQLAAYKENDLSLLQLAYRLENKLSLCVL